MLGSGDHFALEVKGDSMIDAGILDGDTVVIRKTEHAQTGEIVVALVDDEEALRSVVAERLTDEGYQVTQAADGESALKALDGFAFDVIVSDLRLPGVGGHEVIEAALQRYPSVVAIVVTGYGTVKDAVDMIKKDPKKSFEIMGADVKQSGEQFEKSQQYLRWQDRAANQKFFAGEFQAFTKEAADLLLEIGIIKSIPKIDDIVDTSFIK